MVLPTRNLPNPTSYFTYLKNLRFAFNEADAIVIENGVIKVYSLRASAGQMNEGEMTG